MSKITTQDAAAGHFCVHPRTISRWLGQGFIVGYNAGPHDIRVDIDEIEAQLLVNPQMRDGRRPYGTRARIVPMPLPAEPLSVDEMERAGQEVS
ncbi:MAG TPA: hypothetical protein VL294_12180 [Pseudolysinimonas sp.]|jgi:hypothetical protein|nr:hypothetical protein [Pseudolysinimonas sp.]